MDMPPRMMTRSAGRPAAESRGGATGRRAGRDGRKVREPMRRNVNPTGKPKGQVNDQGGGANGGVGANRGMGRVPDFSTMIVQQLQNLLPTILAQVVNNDRRGCTYKEFLACNPKEYDGKGGAIVYTKDQ
ncbi:hypothetical protein Tco_0939968 [Tanacetum coccineum]|uniref:Uncharacterized protein n=1 Tax=Tanacetum coccineum TaxID=301880 RepID=A0ABQ5DMF5_9ASTR